VSPGTQQLAPQSVLPLGQQVFWLVQVPSQQVDCWTPFTSPLQQVVCPLGQQPPPQLIVAHWHWPFWQNWSGGHCSAEHVPLAHVWQGAQSLSPQHC
jgi:hypothetical protein